MYVYIYQYLAVVYLYVSSWFEGATNEVTSGSRPNTPTIAPGSPLRRPLVWNDINFLHTTDTHAWYGGHEHQKSYSGNWAHFISFAERLKEKAHKNHQDLLLVDSGDKHDGNGLSDLTSPNGALLLPIFMKQAYDIVSIGNHEMYLWENFVQERDVVAKHFAENYISSNVEFEVDDGKFEPVGQRYKYFETEVNNYRILAFGFLFNFTRNCNGSKVIPMRDVSELEWFLDALNRHLGLVDLIIINGHTPITPTWEEFYFIHKTIRKYYPDTKIQYFGGHSHIRDFRVLDGLLTAIQSGRFCETVGWLSINMTTIARAPITEIFHRSYIDFNPLSFLFHSGYENVDDFMTPRGTEVKALIHRINDQLDLGKVIGYVPQDYYIDRVPLSHPQNLLKLLTEKVLPLLTYNSTILERTIIINSGSLRYDLFKGAYTLDTHYIVSPFRNKWVKLTLPKHIAVKISYMLNKGRFINFNLLPLHHQFEAFRQLRVYQQRQVNCDDKNDQQKNLTYGYVTHDDFGSNGDDTLHIPLGNHFVPNVVESRQFYNDFKGEDLCDVIFYDFISPNIYWALNALGYPTKEAVGFYSNEYLGLLLDEYARIELEKKGK
ncbi:uncharacterized protein KQ657_005132 [Scheffersomyces spartinae]|uniref:Putative 5'-nucleotidase C-terminal domain-containing protein n=1 Tax=Scheffersomyces spartinae TaxID=45513 RepID=A0A9P8AI15_9ASCO|nr:uncharacterized protein KQ657_005132 [Scheffersomyces spartinae]KAG7193933.1 hypothetical protein KQ657_005132 [Scheffersomyces spartinae]